MTPSGVLKAHRVDVMDIAAGVALLNDTGAQIVINIGSPFVNMPVLEARIQTGAASIDRATHEGSAKICETPPWCLTSRPSPYSVDFDMY